MKKLVLILALSLGATMAAYAQDFTALQGKRLSFDYLFTAQKGKKTFSGNGTVTYQDGAFSLVSDIFKLFNDTQVLWTLDYGAREATIEHGSAENLLTNPEKILSICGFPGKITTAVPSFDQNGMPSGIDVTLKNGDRVSIRCANVRIAEAGSLSDFSFNKKTLDLTWVVTDLR